MGGKTEDKPVRDPIFFSLLPDPDAGQHKLLFSEYFGIRITFWIPAVPHQLWQEEPLDAQ